MHPADKFVGIPYNEPAMDCVDFVALVQRELFGRTLNIPNGHPRGVAGQLALGEMSKQYLVPTDTPKDGDVVMIRHKRKVVGHVGVYFEVRGARYMLHCCESTITSTFHNERDLASLGMLIEGYYTWK